MREYCIPSGMVEIKEPKIFRTNIPNPLGRAIIIYENGMRKYVDLYYIQKLIKCVIGVVLYPIKLIKHRHYRKHYSKYIQCSKHNKFKNN